MSQLGPSLWRPHVGQGALEREEGRCVVCRCLQGCGQEGIKDRGNKRNAEGGKSFSPLCPPTFPEEPRLGEKPPSLGSGLSVVVGISTPHYPLFFWLSPIDGGLGGGHLLLLPFSPG